MRGMSLTDSHSPFSRSATSDQVVDVTHMTLCDSSAILETRLGVTTLEGEEMDHTIDNSLKAMA